MPMNGSQPVSMLREWLGVNKHRTWEAEPTKTTGRIMSDRLKDKTGFIAENVLHDDPGMSQ